MTVASDMSAGASIGRLIRDAQNRIDRLAGATAKSRPPYLAQLAEVLRIAGHEAAAAEKNGPDTLDPDALLWRLREPGYLRAICDHPVPRPGGALVLLPVALTWGILGAAEVIYANRYPDAAAERPSFFAAWLAEPWQQGPLLLSAVIVVSALMIMIGYRRSSRAQRRTDAVDQAVQELEAALLPPLTVLRSRVGSQKNVTMRSNQAADSMLEAAKQLGRAADQLARSMPTVERLGAVIDQMVAALPTLEQQNQQLADVDRRLAETTTGIAEQLGPVITMVTDAASAATAAREAAVGSVSAVTTARKQLDTAHELAARTADQQASAERAQLPFVAAADKVVGAADKLAAVAATLHETAGALRHTISEVNWLAMVADGIRDNDNRHLDNRRSAARPETTSP